MSANIPHEVVKTYNLGRARIEFWDNGITYLAFVPETEVDIELARAVFTIMKQNQQQGERPLILIDMGKYTTLSKEARELSYSPEGLGLTRISAIVVHSLAQRLMINLMADLKASHSIKVKAFRTPGDAREWLLRQKAKRRNK
ncbi:MAG TPA: hypothetical protein VD905_10510 [Flavobacteriales bacterium]|nr:hypothetical protein [Flavobacteriales bacterium]